MRVTNISDAISLNMQLPMKNSWLPKIELYSKNNLK